MRISDDYNAIWARRVPTTSSKKIKKVPLMKRTS